MLPTDSLLDQRQCAAFTAVAATGSFEKAAQQLFITPSAVSLRVQALEKQLGVLLIERTRPCQLTQAGNTLLQFLHNQQRLHQDLLQQLKQPVQHNFYPVKIGLNADSLATWFLDATADIVKWQRILLNLHIDDQSQTHQLLKSGKVQACISDEAKPMQGCAAVSLGTMPYKLYASPDFITHYFADGITRQSLFNAPAVIFNDKDRIHDRFIQQRFGIYQPSYGYHLVPSSESFMTAIAQGLGYGMLPVLQVKLAPQTISQSLVELLPDATLDIPLYWHHWRNQSARMQAFSDEIVYNAQIQLNL